MSPAQGQQQRPKRPEDARPRAFPLRGEAGCLREEASAWSRSALGDAGLRVQPRETHARGASRPPAWGQLSELSPSLSLRCVLTPPQAAPAAMTRRRGPGSLDDRRPCTHGPGCRGSEARASRGRPLPGPRSSARRWPPPPRALTRSSSACASPVPPPPLGRTPALSRQGPLPSGANSKCAERKHYYTNETVSNRSLTSCVKHGIPYFYGSLRAGSHCPGFSVEVDKLFLSRTG